MVKTSGKIVWSALVGADWTDKLGWVINDAFLLAAAIGAGLLSYLAGLASLVSYPALIALGIPPVLANTSNTVGLLGGGLGSTIAAWKDLKRITAYPMGWLSMLSTLGGALGGLLVLVMDPSVFEAVAPWLVLTGALTVLFDPWFTKLSGGRPMKRTLFYGLLAVVTVYGGYFGAGVGVLFVAVCTLGGEFTTHEAVIVKTPLLALANLGASVLFVIQGQVDWHVAIIIGVGSLIGGYAGPYVQKFFSEAMLRWLIAVGGIVMTVWLLVR
ncbi:sulfite exporter TauE/SafE family protein [Schaalia vaccimaxillae]|uniref:sulfite exporter TauE/SafE family protein n=1 Tax=Schaalia vaccimaxillae TaxID=183916 RepID=UPI0003B5E3CA|nr:sulfite exporter TauE/SafE family protein [Schaalia vaccimaxillae]